MDDPIVKSVTQTFFWQLMDSFISSPSSVAICHFICCMLYPITILPYYHPTKDPRVNGVSQDLGVNPVKTAITDPPENLESASGRWKARPRRRSWSRPGEPCFFFCRCTSCFNATSNSASGVTLVLFDKRVLKVTAVIGAAVIGGEPC